MKRFSLNGDELPPHFETKTYSLVCIQHITFILSTRGTHKQRACYYSDCRWQIYLSAFCSFPMIKPGEEAPAPSPTVPGGWCFPRPPATRPLLCRVRHVTVAAHGLPAPIPPLTKQPAPPLHPNPLQACPPPSPSENTPQQAWHTCHVSSRSPASSPKWLSRRHAHARNGTFDTHRRISV